MAYLLTGCAMSPRGKGNSVTMRASEMFDLDRAMTPAEQWEADDSENPVTSFKIPDTSGVTVEMLTADAHGAVTMRQLWRPLAKLLAACERRATAKCTPSTVIGTHHFTGCHEGHHTPSCAVTKAEATIAASLAAVHATGRSSNHAPDTGTSAGRENPLRA